VNVLVGHPAQLISAAEEEAESGVFSEGRGEHGAVETGSSKSAGSKI